MQYRPLGRSGLKISQIILGTMNFGYLTDEAESFSIMDRALEEGITMIDTADVYGGPQKPDMEKGYGLSEEIIGRWLVQGGRRDQIVLATKLYQPMGYGPNDRHLSAYHIRRACDASLKRLKTDHIDLYQMHHIDRSTPWEEIWQAMDVLIQQGKISYVGSSNFAGWHLATAQGFAAQGRRLGLVSEQSLYNLTNRAIESEVLPAARYHGIGVIPWSPLAGGLLGGILNHPDGGRRAALVNQSEDLRSRIESYESLCHSLGEDPAAISLAWLLHQPGVTAPIVGPRLAEQLTLQLHATTIALDKEILARLDKIWPGPRGEAPEAYAW